MANKSCSTPRASSSAATGSRSVAINTSGLSDALKKMAEAQMAEQMQKLKEQAAATPAFNPVATISTVSARMVDLYSRYEKIQEIGKILNGVSLSDPIPDALSIEDITITFRTKDAASEDGFSDYKTASIKNVICAGDIYKLLSGEMGILILTLEQEIKNLHDVTGKSETQYEKARKQWEAANPDRQIKALTTSLVNSATKT